MRCPMKRPIARFTMVCGGVLILLLTATGRGGCDAGSESGILPCIPDLQHAREREIWLPFFGIFPWICSAAGIF